MKSISLLFAASFLCVSLSAQYYYKDLISTQDLIKKQQVYRKNGVKAVDYASFDAGNKPIDGFSCQQTVSADFSSIKTITKTSLSGSSESMSFFNQKGQLVKTSDTTDGNKTITDYTYDDQNRLNSIVSKSTSPGNVSITEKHVWTYDAAGKPDKALKIANNTDTTFITFVKDEQGNIAEEKAIRRGTALPVIYYYYDEDKLLTDIVRYNNKARKLLPDYIFEYEEKRVASMLVAEEGTG
ncbi:MAG: hypothetical protein EOO02_00415, partial [Chitinophagaceae bacterium]